MKVLLSLLILLAALAGASLPQASGFRTATAAEASDPVLIEAAKSGDAVQVSTLLANGTPVDTPDWAGWTALHWAALLLKDNVVDVLLRAGADIERIGKGGKNSGTPLMMAAKKYAGLGTVELLLARGADVNGTDQYGRTALIMAARYGRLQTVKALIAAGADVARTSTLKSWRTALYVAKSKGHSDVVALLRAAGAGQ